MYEVCVEPVWASLLTTASQLFQPNPLKHPRAPKGCLMLIISAYAPTLDAQDKVMETVYTDLDIFLSRVPKEDQVNPA